MITQAHIKILFRKLSVPWSAWRNLRLHRWTDPTGGWPPTPNYYKMKDVQTVLGVLRTHKAYRDKVPHLDDSEVERLMQEDAIVGHDAHAWKDGSDSSFENAVRRLES